MPFPSYYDQVKLGRIFIGQSTDSKTGVALPVADSTAPTFGLWNPTGSGVDAVLIQFAAGFVSTTGAPGALLYNNLANAGSAIATLAPVSAFNAVVPASAYPGKGNAPRTRFTGAGVNTLTTAGTTFATMGISQLTTTGTATTTDIMSLIDNIDGRIIIPPGNFFYVTGSAAPATLFNMSMVWEELPV